MMIDAVIISPVFGVRYEKVENTLLAWANKLCCDDIGIRKVSVGGKEFMIAYDAEHRRNCKYRWLSAKTKDFPETGSAIAGQVLIVGADSTSVTNDDYDLILRNVETSMGIVSDEIRIPIVHLNFAWA